MFDASAVDLISHAPIFGDIDLENLPKELTKGYTEIVSARMAYRENIDDTDALIRLLGQVRKMASTYETYVFLLNEDDNHKAAAFVAASAHQLSFQIDTILKNSVDSNILTDTFISPKISASLLYFIAGYTADSSEMISKVDISSCRDTEVGLLKALKSLLTGQLLDFSNNQPAYILEGEWGESVASNALWAHIHKGINMLLGAISNRSDVFHEQYEEAEKLFDTVKELSQFDKVISIDGSEFAFTYKGIFTGQFYLASLLSVASNTIKDIALINIDIPNEVNDESWMDVLKRISTGRPYLWPNHIEAINQGYLNKGVSSVVSFPTGGGKSTLSELKIATSLIRGEPVIFVVPTLALVDQVSKSLKERFPDVITKMSIDEFNINDLEVEILPDISVMTPESLLVRMSFSPDEFVNVGLFVFDECHLIHSRSSDVADRRSIDAMLCLLRIIKLSDNIDILLMSAMIENNEELSSWLKELINREVLSLNIKWKPTRQAKGCVVYDSQRTAELNVQISVSPKTNSGQLTAAAKRELKAIPYSFFSLNQTWHSNSPDDYKLAKLTNENIILGVNSFDRLTANRNKVAAKIAKNSMRAGIKTLIFASDIKACDSIVKIIDQNISSIIELNDEEDKLKDLIFLEFGGAHSYFSATSAALPHHGLLIKEERQLHESLFRREGGINLIAATSTLAQGINLPAECVIIAGNTRFDPVENRQQELDAHELLNAAGRAGRAGKNATGVVLVIPGEVVSFDSQENRITNYWGAIRDVFSNEDQCLKIEDPLQLVLDKLHLSSDVDVKDIKYFMQRLPVDEDGDSSGFIRTTFGAYQARARNDNAWIDQRIEVANRVFNEIRDMDDSIDRHEWHDKLASASGIEPDLIRQLELSFVESLASFNTSIEVLDWLMKWVAKSYDRLEKLIRIETLESTFGISFTALDESQKVDFFKTTVIDALKQWMQGTNLKDIELGFGTSQRQLNKCSKSRKFVIRVVPEISYLAGILGHVYHYIMIERMEPEINSIKYLSQLARFGFDKSSKLALNRIIDIPTCRVNTHNIFNEIEGYLDNIEETAEFSSLMSMVGRSYETWKMFG